MSELHNLSKPRDVGIEPYARVLGGDAATSLDGRSLHNKQARATCDNSAHMRGGIPGLLEAVNARVLAERRNEDAVLESDAADLERREEFGNGGSVRLRVDCSSCWRILSRREKRNTFGRLDVCRGFVGALARRDDGLGDRDHDLSVRHFDFVFFSLFFSTNLLTLFFVSKILKPARMAAGHLSGKRILRPVASIKYPQQRLFIILLSSSSKRPFVSAQSRMRIKIVAPRENIDQQSYGSFIPISGSVQSNLIKQCPRD